MKHIFLLTSSGRILAHVAEDIPGSLATFPPALPPTHLETQGTWKKKLGMTKPPEDARVLPPSMSTPRRLFTKMERTAAMVLIVPKIPTRMPKPKLSTPTSGLYAT